MIISLCISREQDESLTDIELEHIEKILKSIRFTIDDIEYI